MREPAGFEVMIGYRSTIQGIILILEVPGERPGVP
jgi:hypothetical protein